MLTTQVDFILDGELIVNEFQSGSKDVSIVAPDSQQLNFAIVEANLGGDGGQGGISWNRNLSQTLGAYGAADYGGGAPGGQRGCVVVRCDSTVLKPEVYVSGGRGGQGGLPGRPDQKTSLGPSTAGGRGQDGLNGYEVWLAPLVVEYNLRNTH